MFSQLPEIPLSTGHGFSQSTPAPGDQEGHKGHLHLNRADTYIVKVLDFEGVIFLFNILIKN